MRTSALIGLVCLAAFAAAPVFAARPAPTAAAPAPGTPPAMPQADAAFASLDADKNGSISREEFRTGWLAMARAMAVRERLQQQFASVDANHDGGIDGTEYRNLLLVREAGANAPALAQFDADKNGKLGFGEYVELVKRLAPRTAAADAAPGQ